MVVHNVPKVVDEFRFPRLPSVLLPLGEGGQLVIELCGAPMLAFIDCLLLAPLGLVPWRVRLPRAGVHGENKAADDLRYHVLERTPASVCVVCVSGAWRLRVHRARSKIFIRIHLNRLRYRRLKAQTIKSMLSSMASLLRLSCPHEIGISYL